MSKPALVTSRNPNSSASNSIILIRSADVFFNLQKYRPKIARTGNIITFGKLRPKIDIYEDKHMATDPKIFQYSVARLKKIRL